MPKVVRVKVGDYPDAPIKMMNEAAALRLQQVDPKMYRILEPPKVDVLKLPELPQPEKKNVEPAEVKPANVEPKVEEMKTAETIPAEPKKPGRPPKAK